MGFQADGCTAFDPQAKSAEPHSLRPAGGKNGALYGIRPTCQQCRTTQLALSRWKEWSVVRHSTHMSTVPNHTTCTQQVERMECCTAFDPHAKSAEPHSLHPTGAKNGALYGIRPTCQECRTTQLAPSRWKEWSVARHSTHTPRVPNHTACPKQVGIMEGDPAIMQGIHVGNAMDAGFEARMANTFLDGLLLDGVRPFSDFVELVAPRRRGQPTFYRRNKAAALLVISTINRDLLGNVFSKECG